MNPVELSLFASRISAVCEEMGAVLRRAALSPNIKDRLDFSCAVFDEQGRLCAQAAHIPVHLGSMAYAMGGIVRRCHWAPGDMVIVNDPYLGGTHLPDVTLVAPFFVGGELLGFVVNRAHHADIGAAAPGSMPLSRSLDEEGMVIPPTHLLRHGRMEEGWFEHLLGALRNPAQARGDFAAQISANRAGLRRLQEWVAGLGPGAYRRALSAVNDYGERLARAALRDIPDGRYTFRDVLDDDGAGHTDLPIVVTVTAGDGAIGVDFSGTADQAAGNVNCPLSVAAAAVYYVFRCLMPAHTPACAGSFRPIALRAPAGCLLNARPPAAVAAGNVETSTRVVDAVLGALAQAIPARIPAASHGSMNNVAMGGLEWDYYETLGGGMGAGLLGGGLHAVQTHMTNTLNTPVESLEMHYPLRVRAYAVRRGSGGRGRCPGGDGLIREYEFLEETRVTLLTERRRHTPWGLQGGEAGAPGRNLLQGQSLPPKVHITAEAGQRLTVETPGGGAWGKATMPTP
ncbi:MAG TPA: hydantoinase B/oxoprolinase family protein [Gammaproteobacteria bacterium]|nr:hydantoinase B/oxoprolinase family protein [Gammaproteobacteria bacterium]